MEVEGRPACPRCGRPMKRAGIKGRRQRYTCVACGVNRSAESLVDGSVRIGVIWDDLPVVREVAPAFEKGERQFCVRRQNGRRYYCPYYEECIANTRLGGAVLCERLVVVQASDAEVVM